jgi:hypothetical protein
LSRKPGRRRYSPSEGEEGPNPPRGLSVCGSSGQIALCARRLCRSAGVKESCEDSKGRSSGRIAFSYAQARLKSRSSQGRKEAKVEAFGSVEFFQVWEESLDAQEGATGTVDQAEKADLDR